MIFQNKKALPFLAMLCALGWSLAYPLIKMGYSELGIYPDDLGNKILFAGIRFFAAGILVLITGALQKRKLIIGRREAPLLLSFALVNTTLHYLFSYIGLSYIPSSRSTILDSMGGFLLIILSCLIFDDDTFSKTKVIGCLLGFCGIAVINIAPIGTLFSDISFMGDGMILLNACCAAGGGLITRLISKKMDMLAATGYGMGIGGLLLIFTGIFTGIQHSWNMTAKGVAIVISLILISAVCFGIYNMLLAYHPISKVAIYNALIPVFGVIFSALLLNEPFMWQYAAAGLLVASGIYVVNKK
ncbi:MAG: DMT family transporter [Oscillospiraceae bacterium]|nr:DMT family transporter [Oscillospiraceae bacterium]